MLIDYGFALLVSVLLTSGSVLAADKVEEEVEDEVSATLDRTSNRIEAMMAELQRLSDELDDEDVKLGKRDPTTPASVYAEHKMTDADENRVEYKKSGKVWTENIGADNSIRYMWVAILNDGTSDAAYSATIAKMKTEASKIMKEEFKGDFPTFTHNYNDDGKDKTQQYDFNGDPFGFFDFREFTGRDIDNDKTAQDYPFTRDRASRARNGPRGFYVYGPDSFAEEVSKMDHIAGIGANTISKVSACARDTQVAGCNWGKPRVNYDKLAPGPGGPADPNSQGWWPNPVVCTNLDYDVDYADVISKNVKAFIIDGGIYPTNTDLNNLAVSAPERATTPLETAGSPHEKDHGTHVAATIMGTKFGLARGIPLIVYRGTNPFLIGTLAITNAFENIIRRHTADSLGATTARYVVNWSMENSRARLGDARPDARVMTIVPEIVQGLRQMSRTGIYVSIAGGNQGRYFPENACNGAGATGRGIHADDHVIVAGSHQDNDMREASSTQGPCITAYGPGTAVVSATGNAGGSGPMTGTSMACPHFTAIMARILSEIPAIGNLPSPAVMRAFIRGMAKHDIRNHVSLAFPAPHHAAPVAGTTDLRLFYYCEEKVHRAKKNPFNMGNNPLLVDEKKKVEVPPPGPKISDPAHKGAPVVSVVEKIPKATV